MLQGGGWMAYLVLRTVTGITNTFSFRLLFVALAEAAVGYCLTLLLASCYKIYRTLPRYYAIAAILVTFAVATLIYAVINAYAYSLIRNDTQGVTFGLVVGLLYLCLTLLLGWSALYFGINSYLTVEEQNTQLRLLEAQASTAQLTMLRYQLNPHFLFNTLNSISTLVLLKQTERANAMLARLSNFLRYTLANEPTAHVTLLQEVDTLKLYLEIEKMRFDERLRPEFDIDPRTEKARMPSLLLQPLVENAIKYAVTPQEEGAEICIRTRLAGDRVQITVSDTGPGLTATHRRPNLSTGVGLANIRKRLAQAFGPDHQFATRSNPGGGFSVEIEIPFQFEEQTREAA
ncbi:histidine kinase [Stakelama saccharophila]|uniref:histidine kinase n=2 Tax=Stakelama saccharophila TaxID=3075605 RepID=A0ABZ0BCD9_9SPHN|nr:histidine kinase [Stakelama sp. W311]WNO55100.1 histidine kinase [Stakelama sp. W311]